MFRFSGQISTVGIRVFQSILGINAEQFRSCKKVKTSDLCLKFEMTPPQLQPPVSEGSEVPNDPLAKIRFALFRNVSKDMFFVRFLQCVYLILH